MIDPGVLFCFKVSSGAFAEKQSDPSPADDGPHEEENSPLLRPDNDTSTASRPVAAPETVEEKTGLEYYVYMFRHRRFVTGVLGYFVFAILISSFDTTLPLHVRDAFDWDSMPAGLMFLALQPRHCAQSPCWLVEGPRWDTDPHHDWFSGFGASDVAARGAGG